MPRNSEKLPLSSPKNESNLTRYWDFCEKMWDLSKSKDVILISKLTNIPKVAAPKGELQSRDEEKATFSQKYPDFSSNSTRFLGSKVAIFFCGKVRKIFADYEEKSKLRKNLADFSAKKGPLSTPKNESNSKRIWVFFQKMWHFSHPESTILL